MSGSAIKERNRQIRRAFGPEVEEAVRTFIMAHEEALKGHAAIIRVILFGSLWKRVVWMLFGARVLFWLTKSKERDATPTPED